MKKNIYTLIFSIIFTNMVFSQTIMTDKRFAPSEYSTSRLDFTNQNIIYQYNYIQDTKTKFKKSALTVLQIGDLSSKFVDINTLKGDSLQKAFSNLNSVGMKEMNQILPIIEKIGFKKEVIKNLKNDSLIVHAKVFSTKYEYRTKAPNLSWKLINESKKILDYKVRKALVNYGGRQWVAWYTEQIPINLGPYVFSNLPGLILELYDDKNNFHFRAIGMNNDPMEIYLRTEMEIIKSTKREVSRAERNFHERPELFIKGSYEGMGKLKKIPYNPIELINE